MNPVNERPFLPQAVPSNLHGLMLAFGELVKVLLGVFSEFGFRLNAAIVNDGSLRMAAPLPLRTYTIATLPAAASWPGAVVYVSDGSAGQKFRGSDGSAWVNLG